MPTQVLGPCHITKRVIDYKSDGDTSNNWSTQNDLQMLGKESGKFGIRRKSRYHPNYYINKIGQNSVTSPGDLSRLDVTLTQVKGPSAHAGV